MQENIKLYQKIAKIMGALKRIPKTGTNKYFNYPFATNDDVVDTVRQAMSDNGIAFFAQMTSKEQTPATTAQGKPTIHTVVQMEFTMADTDDGGTFTAMYFGEAMDDADKGIAKAATSAEKYFLLKTFMLSTGDLADETDADLDKVEPGKDEPAKPKSKVIEGSPFGKVNPSPAPGQFAAQEHVGICGQVKVKMTANGKLYYSAILTDDGQDLAASAWTREPFTAVGVDTSQWKDEVDKTYYFPDILVYYTKNDKGYNSVERCESAKERV